MAAVVQVGQYGTRGCVRQAGSTAIVKRGRWLRSCPEMKLVLNSRYGMYGIEEVEVEENRRQNRLADGGQQTRSAFPPDVNGAPPRFSWWGRRERLFWRRGAIRR